MNGVIVRLPAGAAVPIIIVTVVLVLLVVMGNALYQWAQRAPVAARRFGFIVATLASAAAIYFCVNVVPPTRANDPVHEGIQLVSLFDPIFSAVSAAVAGFMWRFAGNRWIGGVQAVAIAAALIAKPFVRPLFSTYNGTAHTFSPTSETHLFFLLSGVALGVVALILLLVPAKRTLSLATARVHS